MIFNKMTILLLPIFLSAALLIDAVCGDMQALNRLIGHPVQWIGKLAIKLEKIFNHGGNVYRFVIGSFITLLLLLFSVTFAYMLNYLAGKIGGLWAQYAVSLFFLAWLIAARPLHDYVKRVYQHQNDIESARKALSHIVGRKTENLDENNISRAAIETLAENFSDAVIAPLCYFALGSAYGCIWGNGLGLEALFFYKALNTLDSLYGYRDARYLYFGKLAAMLDDIANLLPARMTGLLVLLAGLILLGWRDYKHWLACAIRLYRDIPPLWRYYFKKNSHSPNACWSETAFALILAVELGGRRDYTGGIVQENIIGQGGKQNLQFNDIARALKLYRISLYLLQIMLLIAFLLIFWLSLY
ncbi:MAG: adenosylcobinamide-phosphate synthase CbiB [Alphaproteobacteria bacterium]|nr:adenosylcobinamide-phosphate synthase CbiB [Alphaproteobacteria bacterium]